MADAASCLVPEPRGNLRSRLCESAMLSDRIPVSGPVWSTETISGDIVSFPVFIFSPSGPFLPALFMGAFLFL
ncbi:hypothetical protein DTU03_18040 [Salmonella enterica subsp. enterica serovar Kintambo]|uniref:Uncharacterized protein n=1 Tax=Salmonella enterica subsp. enterica serovar Kintambo TaxID=1192730 RepID=A0A5W7RX03_SALET|nr:hypothetical protein [Salmonella enterica subsp. enterica serovar Kintambo]